MRIGIDCRLWYETGVGRYIRNLVLNLQEVDKKSEYVLFVLNKDYEKVKFQISNFKFQIVQSNIRWHTFQEQLEFPKILNKENLDLVHFPYFSVPIFYNRPFVLTVHDLIINHYPTGQASTLPSPIYNLKLLGYRFVISQAVKKAVKIIAVSNATKDEIVHHLGINADKVIVTYEGVDDKIRNPKSEIRNNFQNTKYFLYVGNAYPHKNLERLIEAFKTSSSNANLVFVGKEDYFYKRLESKVKEMNISSNVIFLQNVSDEELCSLYKNAIALIVPSLMEGFGLPAIEAMANGCLVLASDIPTYKEICKDAAIYFNPQNTNELSEKIRLIYSNDSNHFNKNIIKGLERIKQFSWQKMASQTLRIYESSISLR